MVALGDGLPLARWEKAAEQSGGHSIASACQGGMGHAHLLEHGELRDLGGDGSVDLDPLIVDKKTP